MPTVVPMPTAGRKVQDFEDRLDASLLTSEESPKRGRGRPRKEAEPEPVQLDDTVIAQVIQVPFDLWAFSNDCDKLKVTMPEAKLIAKPLKQLLDYYMPNVPEIAWAWIAFSTASYSIVKSRLLIIAAIKKDTSTVQPAGEQEVPDRRGQGRPQSAAFPSLEEIKNGN